MNVSTARARLTGARVARLCSITPEGAPHAVPICFAADGDTLYSAVDAKPKSTTALRRLANVDAHPEVCVLADHYDEEWTRLWWTRADGRARQVQDPAERERAVRLLRQRYPQYRDHTLADAVLAIDVERWTGWSATAGSGR